MHIQTEEAIQNEALNDALWNFKADSFLPHSVGQNHHRDYPITIDTQSLSAKGEGHRELLILLSTTLPSNYAEFARLSILVSNQADKIQAARTLYKELKAARKDVNIHDLRKKTAP